MPGSDKRPTKAIESTVRSGEAATPLPNPLRAVDTDPDYSPTDHHESDEAAPASEPSEPAPRAHKSESGEPSAAAASVLSVGRSWRSRHNSRQRLKSVEAAELELQRAQIIVCRSGTATAQWLSHTLNLMMW